MLLLILIFLCVRSCDHPYKDQALAGTISFSAYSNPSRIISHSSNIEKRRDKASLKALELAFLPSVYVYIKEDFPNIIRTVLKF